MKKIRIGYGSMGWNDILGRAVDLVERGGIQYLCLDYLGELATSILYRMKMKNPETGYVPDLVDWSRKLLPLARDKGVKIITNGGGVNPKAGTLAVAAVAKDLGLDGLRIATVIGDDFTDRISELLGKGIKLSSKPAVGIDKPPEEVREEDFDKIKDRVKGAYAYIGADRIKDALREGADIIIGGRFSDNALFVGACMHEFRWEYEEPYWDKIASAITCGHIVECSCLCTGGAICSQWRDVPQPWNAGDPIAEMCEDGKSAIITKTPQTGGLVNVGTIKEHLVYEVLNPHEYIMPDGIADFTAVKLQDTGRDMVRVSNFKGKPRPDKVRLIMGYEDGWYIEHTQWIAWPDALDKVRAMEKALHEYLEWANLKPRRLATCYMGINMLGGPTVPIPDKDPGFPELGLRVAAHFETREEAALFRRDAYRWSAFPAGYPFGVHYASARPVLLINLWSTLIPREEVHTIYEITEVTTN